MGVLALVRSATWSDLYNSLPILFLLMIIGLWILLPAVLLYWLAFLALRNRPMQPRVKKLLLSVAGMVAIWLLYYLFDKSFFYQGGFGVYSWPLSYSLVLVAAGLFLKMPDAADVVNKNKQK